MKAEPLDLAQIFDRAVQYVVPLYQRPYVWTKALQWEPLWLDVKEVADRQLDTSPTNDDIPHFLGAIVLERALIGGGLIDARTIIDGQQRLTTLQLLVAAARSVAQDHGLASPAQMLEDLLFNRAHLVRSEAEGQKVLPTHRDRIAFREVVQGGAAAATGVHPLHEAFRFFRASILAWVQEAGPEHVADRLDKLSQAIYRRLVLVNIVLDSGDDAQVIFETLNARGTPLLPADLIKNHLFQTATLQHADVDRLHREHWAVFDPEDGQGDGWWREEIAQGRLRRPRIDAFLSHWLAMRTGDDIVTSQLFAEFKRYLAAGPKVAAEVLEDLERYARVYEGFEREPVGTDLGRFLYRLNVMETTTAYPVLLFLLGPEGIADPKDRQDALDAIESWLVRRLVTRQTTKNYNRVFLDLLNHVRKEASERGDGPRSEDVVGFLAGLKGESQAWPRADSVRSALLALPLYTALPRSRVRMLLEALDQSMHSGFNEKVILPTDLTIEHVLPQEWEHNWPLPEDSDPMQGRLDRDAAKHRLGNLTLVTGRLNPKMSNAAWLEKRAALREHSLMRISTDIRNAESWDEAAIAERGTRLAEAAIALWRRPDDEAADSVADVPPEPEQRPVSSVPTGTVLDSPLAIADEIGIGQHLRRVVAVAEELGLVPRPDRYSVMVSPPSDRRVMLFTVWPQWDDGGSFRIWKSPAAFARYMPGVSLEAARAALGSSDGPGLLPATDVEAFLAAVRRLLDDATSARGDATTPEVPAEEDEGTAPGSRIPAEVEQVIDLRAAPTPGLARRFAELVLAEDHVFLRAQRSKGDPWYFQVRHPRCGQVIAYVNPRPDHLRIEYRLLGTSDTYGEATSRGSYYGIVLVVRDDLGLVTAMNLLRDALALVDVPSIALAGES